MNEILIWMLFSFWVPYPQFVQHVHVPSGAEQRWKNVTKCNGGNTVTHPHFSLGVTYPDIDSQITYTHDYTNASKHSKSFYGILSVQYTWASLTVRPNYLIKS